MLFSHEGLEPRLQLGHAAGVWASLMRPGEIVAGLRDLRPHSFLAFDQFCAFHVEDNRARASPMRSSASWTFCIELAKHRRR